jgi:L-alanine-DL-glutamate epimerase-like enolase superfamily enzyme
MAAMEREHDIVWCEEPARRWDTEGLRQVSAGIRAAVATGENQRAPGQFLMLMRHGAADVIQIGHETTGITGALRVADMAQTFERPVAMMNCTGRFMAHVAAVLPHHLMMEVVDSGRNAVLTMDSRIEDGHLVLGDEPGMGLAFDTELLHRHASTGELSQLSQGARSIPRPPDATVHEGPRR